MQYKKLGEICEVLDSKRKPVTKKDRVAGPYPYYGASGIQDYVADYIFDGKYLLIGEDGAKWNSGDKTAFVVEGKIWVNNHAHILSFDNDNMYKLLEYFFLHTDLNEYISGAVIPKLTQQSLLSIPVPVPSLSTQSRIVSELDLLTSLIDNQKKQLDELSKLQQSTFYSMFGDPVENEKEWPVKKLGEVCEKITDGVHKKPNYTSTGIPFISVKDITTGELLFDDVKYISEKDHLLFSKRCPIEKNDILYTKVGATYGRSAIVNTDKQFSLYVSVALLKPIHSIINYKYLNGTLNSPYIKEQADKSIKGIGVPDLHLNMIKDFSIILPPLPLQTAFAEKISAIEEMKKNLKASIAETQKMFDARMQEIFG